MNTSTPIKRLVLRLSLMVVVMFAFGFALGADLRRDVQKPSALMAKPLANMKVCKWLIRVVRCGCSF